MRVQTITSIPEKGFPRLAIMHATRKLARMADSFVAIGRKSVALCDFHSFVRESTFFKRCSFDKCLKVSL